MEKQNDFKTNECENNRISDEELLNQIKIASHNLLSDEEIQDLYKLMKNTMNEIDKKEKKLKNEKHII